LIDGGFLPFFRKEVGRYLSGTEDTERQRLGGLLDESFSPVAKVEGRGGGEGGETGHST